MGRWPGRVTRRAVKTRYTRSSRLGNISARKFRFILRCLFSISSSILRVRRHTHTHTQSRPFGKHVIYARGQRQGHRGFGVLRRNVHLDPIRGVQIKYATYATRRCLHIRYDIILHIHTHTHGHDCVRGGNSNSAYTLVVDIARNDGNVARVIACTVRTRPVRTDRKCETIGVSFGSAIGVFFVVVYGSKNRGGIFRVSVRRVLPRRFHAFSLPPRGVRLLYVMVTRGLG